ncbi:uncharacterized protein MYCFIDRAFT_168119 [Pseudocercospora fijiensis CIRAD86]|uniref:Uncharacterized protein n=1 Tax=Pseudocercospora fijiensis (strain CIRAD86) TaxID=383855 RepID=M2YM49_PSEFD|nr:uncharacterized protein MYCFIDRAFT_168119 [Pseudocercospora fijiensis CIRAD86]EME78800.1 hypothetical protein MYCFIDRAFT_168119 [Pseudocercospora fijiensis CIRAD86]
MHAQSPTIAPYLPWRWRKKRLLAVVAVALIIWALHYVPQSLTLRSGQEQEQEQVSSHANNIPSYRVHEGYDAVRAREPKGAPPKEENEDGAEDAAVKHYYNGVVRFYRLGASLQKVSRTMGMYPQNRNVLFVASSLKSLANLIPMACEMARLDRNYVHVAVFGRSTISLDELMEVNGVTYESCSAYWHDARGDYAEFSSDARAESAVRGALKHIQDYMHPQVIIMDDSNKEEAYFTKAMRFKAEAMDKPLIEIPSGKYANWLWMTKLSAASLVHWHKPVIDIVIQAPMESSGSLIRLLQSLTNADYSGLKMPRLTIELPSKIEHYVQKYLEDNFQWPPGKQSHRHPSLLTVRHRIPSSRLSTEMASLRFVESFYPSKRLDHNLLVLSPQVEISPLFLQYLHYTLLEYRYQGPYASSGSENLVGISLDVPSSSLNGKSDFVVPKVSNMSYGKFEEEEQVNMDDPAPFIYQSPTSTATLIFGDKWMEFHDFLSWRVKATHTGKAVKSKKFVSERQPSWAEFLLELMWARNWFVLHPASTFVTVHNEMAQIPEEFLRSPQDSKATDTPIKPAHPEEEPYLLSPEQPVLTEHLEADPTRTLMPLHQMLPFSGELQEPAQLPAVAFNGGFSEMYTLGDHIEDYVTQFRKSFGGCQGEAVTRPRIIEDGKADDLFCLEGQDMKFADEYQPEEDTDEQVAQEILDGTIDYSDEDEDSTATIGATHATTSTQTAKAKDGGSAKAKVPETKPKGKGDG